MEFVEVSQQNLHVQGIAKGGEFMYFSFTDSLVKVTMTGVIKCQVEVHGGHLGDIDYYNGKIYGCFMGAAKPEQPWNRWSSFYIYEYDADDLRLLRRIHLPKCDEYFEKRNDPEDRIGFAGIDGVTVGRDPKTGEARLMQAAQMLKGEKYVDHIILQFDFDGNYEAEYHFPLGNTTFGIQNLDYDWEENVYWANSYGPQFDWQCQETLFCFSGDLTKTLKKYLFGTATGVECMGKEGFYYSLQMGKNGARACIAFKCDEEFIRAHPYTEEQMSSLVEEITGVKVVDGKYYNIVVPFA